MKNKNGIGWESFEQGDRVQIQTVPVLWVEVTSKEIRDKRPSIYIRLADGSRARCGFDQITSVNRTNGKEQRYETVR